MLVKLKKNKYCLYKKLYNEIKNLNFYINVLKLIGFN